MICWVHGAYSSNRSFNYLRTRLPDHEQIAFEYDANTPLKENLNQLADVLHNNDITGIVGHSLGGVMAAAMVKRGFAPKGAAIAAPLGGFNVTVFFPFTQLMIDVASIRPIFQELTDHDFQDSFLNITTSHNKWTDGVVPIGSQNAIKTNHTTHLTANHFEVLLEPACADALNDYFW